jgi:hypothetical protein
MLWLRTRDRNGSIESIGSVLNLGHGTIGTLQCDIDRRSWIVWKTSRNSNLIHVEDYLARGDRATIRKVSIRDHSTLEHAKDTIHETGSMNHMSTIRNGMSIYVRKKNVRFTALANWMLMYSRSQSDDLNMSVTGWAFDKEIISWIGDNGIVFSLMTIVRITNTGLMVMFRKVALIVRRWLWLCDWWNSVDDNNIIFLFLVVILAIIMWAHVVFRDRRV